MTDYGPNDGPDVRATHDQLQRVVELAQAARQYLADEHEGGFTRSVLELGDIADQLVDLVLSW